MQKGHMPLYFFHLNFGHRVLPDEEGVELPNRSAAREEALAIVCDLADPKIGGNTRRWASWFLQVADDEGQFFRTPIGHPALEIVGPDAPELQTQEPKAQQRQPARAAPSLPEASRSADLVRERLARQQHTAQLLERNRQLRQELSSVFLISESMQVRARQLVAQSRRASCR